MTRVTLQDGPFGTFLIEADDGRSVLVQTDWEYPSVARTFGWSIPASEDGCTHDGTDGTVDCRSCGMTASDMIGAAGEWLADNIGADAEDPGYFDCD